MKRLGLIGGIGPESTVDYYKGLVRGYRARTGLDAYPSLVINSIDMTNMLGLVAARDWMRLINFLAEEMDRLVQAGADFAALCSNTPHVVFDQLQDRAPIPLVSIVDAACGRAKRKGHNRVLVLGTRFTMYSPFYPEGFTRCGIEAVVPTDEEKERIHDAIFPELEEGIVVPEKKQRLVELCGRYIKEQGVDAVLLGCTELPMMLKEGDVDAALLDTVEIHVEALLDEMLQS